MQVAKSGVIKKKTVSRKISRTSKKLSFFLTHSRLIKFLILSIFSFSKPNLVSFKSCN